MIRKIILLRFLQLYRSSGNIGIFRVLFLLLFVLPLIILFLVQHIAMHPWPLVIPAATTYIIWMIHRRRNDYHFLIPVVQRPQKLFLTEYLIFTLPVTLLLISKALYLHTLVLFILAVAISYAVPVQVANSSRTLTLKVIPSGMFEWQSGIRKNLVAVVLFYLPGIAGFYNPGFPAISGLMLTLVFISFYSEYEPRSMLCANISGPGRFLVKKVVIHAGCFALILLPILLLAMIHNDYRLINLGYFVAALNLITFSILLKYYQYRPSSYSGAHQVLVTLVGLISVILPVAIFVALANLFLAAGAHHNLKNLLDDHS